MTQRTEKPRFPQKTAESYRLEEEELADNGSRVGATIVGVGWVFSLGQEQGLEGVMGGLEGFRGAMRKAPIIPP